MNHEAALTITTHVMMHTVFIEFSNLDLEDTIYFRNTINGLRHLCIRALDKLLVCLRPNNIRTLIVYCMPQYCDLSK
jgi:hypothetical protein